MATIASRNAAEATLQAVRLYRRCLQEIPNVIATFELTFHPDTMRKRIRRDFYKHKDIKDTQTIDLLVFRGQIELDEVLRMWKQRPHLVSYFGEEAETEEKDFMENFFNGITSRRNFTS